MYASLDGIVKKDAIFASNTSSISVTELLTAIEAAGKIHRAALF